MTLLDSFKKSRIIYLRKKRRFGQVVSEFYYKWDRNWRSCKSTMTTKAPAQFQWKNTWNQYFAVIAGKVLNSFGFNFFSFSCEQIEAWFESKTQILLTFFGAANILQFSQGNTNGWPSPALPVLSSEKSPLVTGPLTIEELSWIGSINCIGLSLDLKYYASYVKKYSLSWAWRLICFFLIYFYDRNLSNAHHVFEESILEYFDFKTTADVQCHCYSGGIFGSLLYGYIIPIVGSKRALVLLTIPSVAFWVMIYFGFNFYHIFIARFVAGAAGGSMQSAVMLYVAEIANNEYVIAV